MIDLALLLAGGGVILAFAANRNLRPALCFACAALLLFAVEVSPPSPYAAPLAQAASAPERALWLMEQIARPVMAVLAKANPWGVVLMGALAALAGLAGLAERAAAAWRNGQRHLRERRMEQDRQAHLPPSSWV